MLEHLVAAAAAEDLPVIVDIWDRNGTAGSASTGITAFAHLGPAEVTDEALRIMRDKNVATITTAAYADARLRWKQLGGGFTDFDLIADVTPDWVFEPLADIVIHDKGSSYGSGGAEQREIALRNTKSLFDAGILLVAGTDAPAPGLFFGEGLHRELELLVEAGLTPLQAISAATKSAATLVQADDWGVLDSGKIADILLVRGDPSLRIGDTRNIAKVIQGGRILDRESLKFDASTDPGFRPAGNVTRPE
jgi:hypothetical protein